MRTRLALTAAIFAASSIFPRFLNAETIEPPEKGEMVQSMSFPKKWMPRLGVSYVLDGEGEGTQSGVEFNLSVYRDLLNPNMGIIGALFEAYGGQSAGEGTAGLRAMGMLKFFMFAGGADYSITEDDWSSIWSIQFPLRRGGLFGLGGDFRVDWLPGRENTFNFGVNIPIFQPWMGKTRPKSEHVSLPGKSRKKDPEFDPSADLSSVISEIETSAFDIQDYTTFFSDDEFNLEKEEDIEKIEEGVAEFKKYFYTTNEDYPEGHTFNAVINTYHRKLERAFLIACGGDRELGSETADLAREVLLDEILLPYNRLLGQRKKDETILGLAIEAKKKFAEGIHSHSEVSADESAALNYLFARLIDIVETNRKALKKNWQDSRLVWLPLHFSFDTDQHDTRAELDAIIERAVGKGFTTGNDIHYVINEQFQWELARMIHVAEDYHVLWIHDYRGTNNLGDPDLIGYRMSTGGYLKAIIKNVRAYDRTGKMPMLTVILDQFYFEAGNGKLWLEFLEDPLDRRVDLPDGFEEWEENILSLQAELRAAVDSSSALSAGREAYGEKWLKNLVKVHINITNPADFSFRSANMFKYLFFVPDILFRDHRKISFYDLTELDPGRGEGMFTGMGVGEHYAGATWDDRAILARGPAALDLKTEARLLLLSQGFKEDKIPAPLRPVQKTDDYDEKVQALVEKGWTASSMQLHNHTGFAQKWDNVVKGVLYNLMPSGSFMLIPDSLWNSTFWGSMLYGSAMRGCRIHVIAPSLLNAPSDGFPQMARANELFTRLVLLRDAFSDELEQVGGCFRLGVYNYDGDVQDQVGRAEAMLRHLDEYDWVHEVFPSHESVRGYIEEAVDILKKEEYRTTHLTSDAVARKPKIHLKAQFFYTPQVGKTLLPLEAWGPLFRDYLIARAAQSAHENSYVDVKELRENLARRSGQLIREWAMTADPEELKKLSMYLTIGSQNQDYRGKIMDGEVLFVTSGLRAGVAFLDLIEMLLISTWIEDLQTLDEIMPAHSGFKAKLSRYIKLAL
jgi:hypothetical protein